MSTQSTLKKRHRKSIISEHDVEARNLIYARYRLTVNSFALCTQPVIGRSDSFCLDRFGLLTLFMSSRFLVTSFFISQLNTKFLIFYRGAIDKH